MKNFRTFLALFMAILFLWPCFLSAQKVLTLEDAVLKQYTQLAPERLPGLQWIPGTGDWSYFSSDRQKILRGGIKEPEGKVVMDVARLNRHLVAKDRIKKFPAIIWQDAQTFTFFLKNKLYRVEIDKDHSSVLPLPPGADNPDICPVTGNVAFTTGNNLSVMTKDGQIFTVTQIDDPGIVSGRSIARQEFGILKGTFWSSDGKRLAFYQKDERQVTDYPLLNIGPRPAIDKYIKYPMTGQKSEHARAGIYEMTSREVTYLKVSGESDQYLTNLGWDPSGAYLYLALVNRAQNHMWLNKYDVKSGEKVKTLFEEQNDKWVEPETPVYFPRNFKDRFIWMSEREGFMNLYLYDTAGILIRPLTKNRWVATEILGLDKSGKHLIFAGTGEDPREAHAFSVDLKNLAVKRLTPAGGVHRLMLSPDGRYMLDTWSSLRTPRSVDVIDVKTGKRIKNILSAPDPLKEYRIGKTEFITLKTEDGTPLYGRLIKPSNFDPGRKYPVLVYVYGGPHAQLVRDNWLGGARLWMYYQAEQGYVIFTLDGRGSARRGFAFESVIHRQLGTAEVEDQMTGIAYLKAQTWVDTARIAVHGWSFGGFMTISLMLRRPGTFIAGVAGGPVTDWKYYEVMYGERYMDRPRENPDGYAQASLLNKAGNLNGDLLIIHGAMDSTVVMQNSYALLDEFIKNGKQVDFFVYPDHPHNVRGRDRLHLMRKVLYYIDAKIREKEEKQRTGDKR